MRAHSYYIIEWEDKVELPVFGVWNLNKSAM